MNNTTVISPLRLQKDFVSSGTTLFDALTTPYVMEHWLFKNDTNKTEFTGEIAEGKKLSITEFDNGKTIDHTLVSLKIGRPEIFKFSLEVPDHFQGISEVTVEVKESMSGAQLIFTQENIDTTKTADAWQMMLGNLEAVLKMPYQITESSPKEDLLKAISVVIMQITGFLKSLDEDQINVQPFKGSWTAGQLVRHIIKSTNGIDKTLQSKTSPAHRSPTERVLELKASFLDITQKMQSPDFIVPEQKDYDRKNLLADLEKGMKQLSGAVATCNADELLEGLPFGPITKLEILHFVFYHSQRHLFQMKKICDVVNSK